MESEMHNKPLNSSVGHKLKPKEWKGVSFWNITPKLISTCWNADKPCARAVTAFHEHALKWASRDSWETRKMSKSGLNMCGCPWLQTAQELIRTCVNIYLQVSSGFFWWALWWTVHEDSKEEWCGRLLKDCAGSGSCSAFKHQLHYCTYHCDSAVSIILFGVCLP